MLKGEITGLRAIERGDLEALRGWRNQPEMRRFFREYREISEDMQTAWYEKKVLADPATRMFAIEDLVTGDLLGACGLCYIDTINRNADFSIYLGADDLYIDDEFALMRAARSSPTGFTSLACTRSGPRSTLSMKPSSGFSISSACSARACIAKPTSLKANGWTVCFMAFSRGTIRRAAS